MSRINVFFFRLNSSESYFNCLKAYKSLIKNMETRVTLIYLEFFSAFFEPKISKIQKTGKIENLFFFK